MKVLVGGRFNILHAGHIHLLKKAKSLGDYLVVVVANDKTILKDQKAKFFSQNIRKRVVESVKYVDKAIIGYPIQGERGYLKIIKDEKPDIIALGYDQKLRISEFRKRLRELGLACRIVKIDFLKGFETKKYYK